MSCLIPKDPGAVLDYKFDWSGEFEQAEQIANRVVTSQDGLNLDSHTDDGSSVTVWLSGGQAGNSYSVDCEIQTNSNPARTFRRSIVIRCMNR